VDPDPAYLAKENPDLDADPDPGLDPGFLKTKNKNKITAENKIIYFYHELQYTFP
jgi:hypothetical protein